MVYGGTIRAGKGTCGTHKGLPLDIISAYQVYGESLGFFYFYFYFHFHFQKKKKFLFHFFS